ncbi:MAG TPA: competence/damage-inducible protein A [Vicinamibacterales bacterium]|jgi:nicotinamide-nucleotide amidase|nr:competence/damage-inducible protein A [Vicinamibacterales bacterium]
MTRRIETAEILAVGSEMLTPFRVDTNSLFLTARLNELGVIVRRKSVVGDRRDDLAACVREALARVDLVITTGGLGPTDDDLTREVVADVLGRALTIDETILAAIQARFARRGVPMPSINQRQACVPSGATVLPNSEGTAPGLLLEHHERLIALLPGPPREMQPMFVRAIAPLVEARSPGRRLQRRVVKVTGRSESQVEEIANPIYTALSHGGIVVDATILATPGQIEVHLESAGDDHDAIRAVLDDGVARLAAALGPAVFSTDGRTLEEVVGDALRARGWRIAVAESCTGGLLGGRLTDVPGSSAYVVGGVIAYDNAVKVHELDVPATMIDEQGAVSEPVAAAMAAGARRRFQAEIGVAITGIAGPGGGTPAKPVGTVCVAVSTPDTASIRTLSFPGDRDAIRRHSTAAALDMVRRALSD